MRNKEKMLILATDEDNIASNLVRVRAKRKNADFHPIRVTGDHVSFLARTRTEILTRHKI